MRRMRIAMWSLLAIAVLGACGAGGENDAVVIARENGPCAQPGTVAVCGLRDHPDRPYEIHIPATYAAGQPVDLWVNLHGGGGSMNSAAVASCPNNDPADPACIHNLGETHGFITVYPNGTGSGLVPNLRTWNGGGDGEEFYCASGRACRDDVDDIGYLGALIDEITADYTIDHVFFSGLSNGAAMSHRVACELGDRVTAIAAVAGANQFSTSAPCRPAAPVAVLQIHGTEDPCWQYEGGEDACVDRSGGLRLGVVESTVAWADRNGCDSTPVEAAMADLDPTDGVTTTELRWTGCVEGGSVVLLRMNGAGHTWPDGTIGISEGRVGATSRDWDTSLIWQFFVAAS